MIYIFSCYILSYLRVQNIVSVLVTLWTSVEMTPMKLVYCFALMKIPFHRMSGYQLLTSLPTQLITDVDSMPLCLAFCPITGGFFVFTPWIKCSFVQGLWCIWNFMYCEKILCPSRLFILRLFFLCAPYALPNNETHRNCRWKYPTDTNLSLSAAVPANALSPHATVGCPKLPWFGPRYSYRMHMCWAKWMFQFPALQFLVSVSSLLPLIG